MASPKRHWPSMFKSKPCNTHHQWQHDSNPSLMSSSCYKAPYISVAGCEERSRDTKPRWNPKPEQIRILEAIFNSGMVNPPRDEIRKIRAQLQDYSQVGDANVFYWFQNRKSRSKHKQRNLQNSKQQSQQNQQTQQTPTTNITTITAPSSSSSSSEKSSPKGPNKSTISLSSPNVMDVSNSPTAFVNQTYFHQPQNEFLNEPFFFPAQQATEGAGFTQGFDFSDLTNVIQVPEQTVGPCTTLLLSEISNHGASRKEHEEKMKMKLQISNSAVTTAPSTHAIPPPTVSSPATITVPSNNHHIQGVGESDEVGPGGAARSTVFINDVAFDVAMGPFKVREAFGDDAILINSAGQPFLTNEWRPTLQSLQNGGFYYLVRSLSPVSE
ncbi:WUSCHEL-related homeobox 9-like [Durio zibethinus]|uniref:WUSCHEL-related homeobox 9-like n=1 Tax=Durio zibethinus TaxID=66656 RepID=A0A6P5WZY7_DURZI|nr:WUSCHEL-related homeobox 9-like [Durio zibethinus]